MNDLDNIKNQSLVTIEGIKEIAIIDQESYGSAASLLKTVRHFKSQVSDYFKPMLEKAKEAKRKAEESRKEIVTKQELELEPIVKAEKVLLLKCRNYEDDCRREQVELDLIAAEDARKKEEELTKQKMEEAKDLEWEGDKEGSLKKKIEAQSVLIDPEPEKAIEKVTGLGIRRDWDFEVVDFSKIPRQYLIVDNVAIRKIVKAMKADTDIPGIKAFIK